MTSSGKKIQWKGTVLLNEQYHRLHAPAAPLLPTAAPAASPAPAVAAPVSAMHTKIIDALCPPPLLDPESADAAKENREPSADEENKKLLVDEHKRLRVASMSMLEGIVFKLLVSTRQEASTVAWHGTTSTMQIVDMVSATLGTDPATRQQVLTLLMLTLPSAAPECVGPYLKPYWCFRTGPHLLHDSAVPAQPCGDKACCAPAQCDRQGPLPACAHRGVWLARLPDAQGEDECGLAGPHEAHPEQRGHAVGGCANSRPTRDGRLCASRGRGARARAHAHGRGTQLRARARRRARAHEAGRLCQAPSGHAVDVQAGDVRSGQAVHGQRTLQDCAHRLGRRSSALDHPREERERQGLQDDRRDQAVRASPRIYSLRSPTCPPARLTFPTRDHTIRPVALKAASCHRDPRAQGQGRAAQAGLQGSRGAA